MQMQMKFYEVKRNVEACRLSFNDARITNARMQVKLYKIKQIKLT